MTNEWPPLNCPHCQASLDAGDIYESMLKHYGENDKERAKEAAKNYGWTEELPLRFSRIIAIYSMTTDRTEGWECPDCKKVIEGVCCTPGLRATGAKVVK